MKATRGTADPGREPTIEVHWPRPDVAVVSLGGEHDLASAGELGRTLADTTVTAHHLIIDLSDASFIDSYTMGTLIKAKHDADAQARHFNVVVGSSSIVARALDIAEVLPMLNRVRTLEEALAAS